MEDGEELTESRKFLKYGSLFVLAKKISDLENRIRQEKNGIKKLNYLGRQQKLLGYLVVVGAYFSKD